MLRLILDRINLATVALGLFRLESPDFFDNNVITPYRGLASRSPGSLFARAVLESAGPDRYGGCS